MLLISDSLIEAIQFPNLIEHKLFFNLDTFGASIFLNNFKG